MNDTCNAPPWPDDKTNLLKTYFIEGYSYGLIAQKIGGYTRNAVISKAKRLKLTREEVEPTHRKAARGGDSTGRRRHAKPNGHHISDSLASPLIDDLAIPESQRLSILQLTNDTCHWPVGHPQEPGFFFCGAKANGASSYCPAHCRIAYTIPPKSTRPANWALQKPWMMQGQK